MPVVRSRTHVAIPPGATIKEQLEDRAMSQKEFAARMDMSEKHISKLINGEVQLTHSVALRLEYVLGVPASFWNGLEAVYREEITLIDAENAMDDDIKIASKFPYNEMVSLGWIPSAKSPADKVANLRKYFEVVELSLLENSIITRLTCRKLSLTNKMDLLLIAWAQAVRISARSIYSDPVNISGLIKVIPNIRSATTLRSEEFCPLVQRVLSDNGIVLVFMPNLSGSDTQSISFRDGNRIVIGMAASSESDDQFWYSMFHELAHIILGHILQPQDVTEQNEIDADYWSEHTLIAEVEFEEFNEEGDYTEKSVRRFAKALGISPGIVVGRLQKEGIIKKNMLNELKETYKIAI